MENKQSKLIFYKVIDKTYTPLPYAEIGIHAGFPSPAQDFLDLELDLNSYVIKHPQSTFFARVVGDSMNDVGLQENDIIVIDRSLKPSDGDMAVCYIDGEFAIKFIKMEKKVIYLVSANKKYQPIKITEENDFFIWGIVTYSVSDRKNKKHL